MNKLVLLLLLFSSILIDSCITIKDSSVVQDNFLGSSINSKLIYDKESNGSFFCPIRLSMQPMDKLIAIAFKGESDYNQIELQFFNDKINGKGIVAMLTKKSDGDIDIYFSNGLHFDNQMYSFDILHEPRETNIDYSFKITNTGVLCDLSMIDYKGNKIKLLVIQSSKALDWSNFLAPVAPKSINPSFFPFYYMRNTIFCRSSDTKIDLLINNKKQKPKKIPLLVNKKIVYLSRYADMPIIGMWHSDTSAILNPINKNSSTVNDYELIDNNGHLEIKSIASYMDNGHNMKLHFTPSIPDLRCLKSGIVIGGRYTISCDSITGIIGGEYKLIKTNNQIAFSCQPTKGFQPNPGKVWVKTLTWQSFLDYIEQDNTMTMSSKWTKK